MIDAPKLPVSHEDRLKNLRLMYADHPHPNEDARASNQGHAFIHGRAGKEG